MRGITKYKHQFIYMVVLLLIISTVIGFLVIPNQEVTIDSAIADGLVYSLTSQKGSSEYGDILEIYREDDNEERQYIYEKSFSDLKPWKIELADVDGDGELEILIAVHKSTHFDKYEKNRMFVFNYNDEKLIKKWTGSQIAGVWNDFHVGDLLPIPGAELIFIEQVEDQGERIAIYYWFDFGFTLLATSEIYNQIEDFTIVGENRIHVTAGLEGNSMTLMVSDGEIIETK